LCWRSLEIFHRIFFSHSGYTSFSPCTGTLSRCASGWHVRPFLLWHGLF
jgi:hypothetical protein